MYVLDCIWIWDVAALLFVPSEEGYVGGIGLRAFWRGALCSPGWIGAGLGKKAMGNFTS